MELVGVDLALHDDQRIDATDIVEALAVAVGLTADASRANVKVPAARHRDNLGLQRGSPECLTQIKAVRRAALSSCPRGHPGTNATPADGQVRFPRSQEEGMKALVCRGPGIKAVEDRPKPEIKAPARLITHRFPFDRILDAYDTFGRAADTRALKVIIAM